MGGGEMIREVHLRHTTFNDVPYKFEAGTPDIAAAIGLGAALDYLSRSGHGARPGARARARRVRARQCCRERVPSIRIHGPLTSASERAGIITFNLADAHPHDVATLLDREAIAIRAGHHCTMPLHQRLGEEASARASFYVYTDRDDIDRLAEALNKVERLFAAQLAPSAKLTEHDGRPVPRRDPRALPQPAQLRHARDADAGQGGRQPAVRRPDHADARASDDDGKVKDVAFTGRGCAISQASASMLTDEIKGKSLAEIAATGQPGRARQPGHRDQPGADEVRDALARDAADRPMSGDRVDVAGHRPDEE